MTWGAFLFVCLGGLMMLIVIHLLRQILDKAEEIRCGLVDVEKELEAKEAAELLQRQREMLRQVVERNS